MGCHPRDAALGWGDGPEGFVSYLQSLVRDTLVLRLQRMSRPRWGSAPELLKKIPSSGPGGNIGFDEVMYVLSVRMSVSTRIAEAA